MKVDGSGFNIERNFWELNPQLKYMSPFKDLYDSDESKGKEHSSRVMWCVYLHQDPSYENKVYRLPPADKESTIRNYYDKFDFSDPLIQHCLSAYEEFCLTPAARAFKNEERSFIDRATMIESSKYTLSEPLKNPDGSIVLQGGRPVIIPGTAKELDMLRKNTLSILNNYMEAKKLFEDEQRNAPRLFGGGEENLFEEQGFIEFEEE